MSSISDRWRQRFRPAERERTLDPTAASLFVPAPNALRWAVGEQHLSQPTAARYTGSWQAIRDFFQLRCPRCNGGPYFGVPRDGGIGDCWHKTPEQLFDEVLLEWDQEAEEDVCPSCQSRRSELVARGELRTYGQMHLLAGMRSLPFRTSSVCSDQGLLSLAEIFEINTRLPTDGALGAAPEAASGAALVEDVTTGLTVQSERGPARVTQAGHSGVKPIRRLRCAGGWTSETSNEHKLRVVRADGKRHWVEAQHVQPGDALILNVGADLWGPEHLDPDLAYLAGLYAGDGSRVDRNKDETRAYTSKTLEDEEVLSVCPNAKAETKAVPSRVRRANRASVIQFLKGYADTDWFCALGKTGQQKKDVSESVSESDVLKPSIGYDTVSKDLASQVRLLLLNLGIRTNGHERPTRGYLSEGRTGTTTYHVTIAVQSIPLFAELIGFRHIERARALEDCLAHIEARPKRPKDEDGPRGTADAWIDYIGQVREALGRGERRGRAERVLPSYFGRRGMGQFSTALRGARRAVSPTIVRAFFDRLRATEHWPKVQALPETQTWLEFADPAWVPIEVFSSEQGEEVPMGDLSVPGPESYVAGGILGHNSGKSFTGAIIATYMEHRLLCHAHQHLTTLEDLGRPPGLSGYFGHSAATQYEATFLAASGDQAKDTVFAIFKGLRGLSPWFSRYRRWVLAEQATQSRQRMPWEYKDDLVLQIRNEHPDVRMVITSGHSNSRTQAGRTRLFVVFDEIGRMKVSTSALGADELYLTMDSSLQTTRGVVSRLGLEPWMGAIISVSSPKSRFDKAYRLWQDSQRIPEMYAFRAATWDFNPFEPRSNFDGAFRKDPVGAMTDFGASPPGTENPLIDDPIRFRQLAVDPEARASSTFRHVEMRQQDRYFYIAAEIQHMPFVAANPRQLGRAAAAAHTPRVIFGDAGESFDAFALACGYGRPVGVAPDGKPIMATVVEWVVRILPPPGYQVWFDCVLDIVRNAAQRQNVRRVRFDRWQSTHLIQKCRDYVADCERLSLKTEHFVSFRSDAYSGRVRLLPPLSTDAEPGIPVDDEGAGWAWKVTPPEMSAQAAGLYELLGLTRDPEKGKITNPRKGLERGWASDDTAQVLVGLHHLISDAGYHEKFDDRSRRAARERAEAQVQQAGSMTRFLPSVWRQRR